MPKQPPESADAQVLLAMRRVAFRQWLAAPFGSSDKAAWLDEMRRAREAYVDLTGQWTNLRPAKPHPDEPMA